MISKFENYTKEELQEILDNSNTFKEVLRKIGLSGIGNNYNTLHRYIDKYNLSTDYIDKHRKDVQSHSKYDTKESFTEAVEKGICKIKSKSMIERLVEYELKKYCCEECGVSNWNNKPIRLELHHKNGINDDDRLENLQLLCPNCHSQTDNFRALNISHVEKTKNKRIRKKKLCPICEEKEIKLSSNMCRECYEKLRRLSNNKINMDNDEQKKDLCPICKINYKNKTSEMCSECRKKERTKNFPPKEELEALIYTTPFTKIGELYGVTDNAVRRWCKKYNLPSTRNEIKQS